MKVIARDLTDEQFKRLELFVTACMDGVQLARESAATLNAASLFKFVIWDANDRYVYVMVGDNKVRAIGALSQPWQNFKKKELTTITDKSFTLYECSAEHDASGKYKLFPARLSQSVMNLINSNKQMLKLVP